MPPKKDAFADLFPSARPKPPMNARAEAAAPAVARSRAGASVWGDLDVLSANNSSTSLRRPGATIVGDSADALGSVASTGPAQDPWDELGTLQQPSPQLQLRQLQPHLQPQQKELNLLDDEFTDAYVEPVPARSDAEIRKPPASSRDKTLAELVDIGFSIDAANQAIDNAGNDLQACVNEIMAGTRQLPPAQPPRPLLSLRALPSVEAKISNLSQELFSKASLFLAKGRDTVLKNIEQLQHPDSLQPAWMRDLHKYQNWVGLPEQLIDQLRRLLQERDEARRERTQRTSPAPLRASPASQRASPAPPTVSTPLPRASPALSKASLAPQRSTTSSPAAAAAISAPSGSTLPPEVDLLGLSQSSTSHPAQQLDQFLQTDFDNFRTLATTAFKNGDYDAALTNYRKCLEILPANFDERIVILSNLALTAIKIGNYKQAQVYCGEGLQMIPSDRVADQTWYIKDKPIRAWYIKLQLRHAESLEMLERFPQALQSYQQLISIGVNDIKIMQGKNRVDRIVNPSAQKQMPKKTPKQTPATSETPQSKAALRSGAITGAGKVSALVARQFEAQRQEEEDKFRLHDQVQATITQWSNGKEDNLRTLLVGLPEVIPGHLNFTFLSKPITIGDIMLPKRVKINYMKVISAIHPDKLGKLALEDRLICLGVFVILNKAWDSFREKEL